MGLLDGKVAFITGGARGQGRAHAVVCAREGADIVFIDTLEPLTAPVYPMPGQDDIDETVRQVTALGRKVIGVAADVRSQEQLDAVVARAIDELGKIDILIANAGIHNRSPFWEMTEEVWDEVIAINLTGVWKSCKAVAPHMIGRGQGSIVLTSSVNGIIPATIASHYAAAKFGVIGLAKSFALELAPYGVRVNSIHPGLVATGMVMNQSTYDLATGHPDGTEEEFMAGSRHYFAFKGQQAMDPMVIAEATLVLNTDHASGVTGSMLPIEGGHLLMPGHNWNPAL